MKYRGSEPKGIILMAKVHHQTRKDLYKYLELVKEQIENNTLTFNEATLAFKDSDGRTISETFLREVCKDFGIIPKFIIKPIKITTAKDKISALTRALVILYALLKIPIPAELRQLVKIIPEITTTVENSVGPKLDKEARPDQLFVTKE